VFVYLIAAIITFPSDVGFYVIAVVISGMLSPITSTFNVNTLDCVGIKLARRGIAFVYAVSTTFNIVWPMLFGECEIMT